MFVGQGWVPICLLVFMSYVSSTSILVRQRSWAAVRARGHLIYIMKTIPWPLLVFIFVFNIFNNNIHSVPRMRMLMRRRIYRFQKLVKIGKVFEEFFHCNYSLSQWVGMTDCFHWYIIITGILQFNAYFAFNITGYKAKNYKLRQSLT